jgi:hypothetical protein
MSMLKDGQKQEAFLQCIHLVENHRRGTMNLKHK